MLFSAPILATAAAVAPPRIELDLSAMTDAYKLDAPIVRSHDLGYTQPDSTPVMSRQDYTEKCPAGASTTSSCPFPSAKAYDHMDKEITTVTTRVKLVDLNGNPQNEFVDQVNFALRSTYLFHYDAVDQAGNHAEQVIFALILDDTTAPTIALCGGIAETVEAASYLGTTAPAAHSGDVLGDNWQLCESGIPAGDGKKYAYDNIDTTSLGLNVPILYTIQQVDDASIDLCRDVPYATAVTKITTDIVGRFLVTLCATDTAGPYGAGGTNNTYCTHKDVTVEDTRHPVIKLHGASSIPHQCALAAVDDPKNATDGSDLPVESPAYVDVALPGDIDTEKYGSHGRGVWIEDYLDTECTSSDCILRPITPTVVGLRGTNVDSTKMGTYSITYKGTDHAGLDATDVVRTVEVIDAVMPVIDMGGVLAVDVVAQNEVNALTTEPVDTMPTCSDACDPTPWPITTSWGDKPYTDRVIGTYTRTYTCCDHTEDRTAKGNCATATRTFTVRDESAPVIDVVGDCAMTLEAARSAPIDGMAEFGGYATSEFPYDHNLNDDGVLQYVDKSAVCTDYVDGTLSHAIEESGDNVNLQIPGLYTIRYDCKDLSGVEATPKYRYVKVQDTRCPTVTLEGDAEINIEAGFSYTDASATATDDLDGDISSEVTTDGDQVNVASSFYSRRSCREIKSAFAAATDGMYQITTYVNGQYMRISVWCDMQTAGTNSGYTYYAINQGTPVVPYNQDGNNAQGDCATVGLKMAIFTDSQSYTESMHAAYDHFHSGLQPHSVFFPAGSATTDSYLCSTNDAGTGTGDVVVDGVDAPEANVFSVKKRGTEHDTGHVMAADSVSRAEAGKYVIFYHVRDNANNPECVTPKRTVTVTDTLPPVITLHMNNTLIHTSKYDQRSTVDAREQLNPAGSSDSNPYIHTSYTGGADPVNGYWGNGEANPANSYTTTGNQDNANQDLDQFGMYMAEQPEASSVDGWVIAAVASGVAGLALFASSRKDAEHTTVPV